MDELLNLPLPLPEGWQVALRHANGFWLTTATCPGANGYGWTKRLRDVERFPSEAAAREALASTDADIDNITMIRIPPNYREVPTLRQDVEPDFEDLLAELTPDDCGREERGDFLLMYEGFTDACWDDAQEKGKTIEGLEVEILADWNDRLPTMTRVKWGWTNEPGFFVETSFWAIYRASADKRKAA